MTLHTSSGLRVAIASSGVHHVKRGIETWAIDLAAALHERDLDVTLFSGSGPAVYPYEKTVSCLHRHSKINRLVTERSPGFLWRVHLTSEYELEQLTFAYHLMMGRHLRGFDLVHTQDPLLAAILDGYYRRGLLEAATLLAHGTEEPAKYLSRFSYLQHLAPHHFDEALSFRRPKSQWFTIPNFIDTALFAPRTDNRIREELGIPEEAFVVLTSAAIKREHKRIDYLISEFSRFWRETDSTAHLIVAGAGHGDTAELHRIAKEQCPMHIHFLVDQPRGRMPAIYNAGNLFVLCSLKEMMPIALLEATASGLPCLVNQHPVVSWMVGNGGEAIDMSGAGSLAASLKEWRDHATLAVGGQKARRHALTNFSRDAVVEQILDAYREIVK